MSNWVDLPVPMASPGFESRYEDWREYDEMEVE